MNPNEQEYRILQQHLDKMPLGFPPTKSGSDISLLNYFFDPEEIPILLELNHKYKSHDNIIQSLKKKNRDPEHSNEILEKLIKKGVINWKEAENGRVYKLLPLVVGLDESQNYNRSAEYLKLIREYMIESKFVFQLVNSEIPQLRTIPVEQSLVPKHLVSTYDDVRSIIESISGPIVLIDCICKKGARINGKECKQTSRLDTCLVFNEVASRWIKRGLGKVLNKEEALEVLKKNQEDGLVLQPSNSKNPDFLCSCCGCCCGILSLQKMIPNPAKFWTSSYQAQVNSELCQGCETCLTKCQVNAIKIINEKATIDLKRCIGCGNCITICPNNALSLIKKDQEIKVPEDSEDLYESILHLR